MGDEKMAAWRKGKDARCTSPTFSRYSRRGGPSALTRLQAAQTRFTRAVGFEVALEVALLTAGYFFASAAPSSRSSLSTVTFRGRPPRAPFARAAAALDSLRLAPPSLPSRLAMNDRDPSTPASNGATRMSASTVGKYRPVPDAVISIVFRSLSEAFSKP